MKQAKVQLAKIVETETQLATQYAMSKLKDGNIVLQKHAAVLSEQSSQFQMLMSEKIGKQIKSEYKKLHSNLESVIAIVQSQIAEGNASAEKDLYDILRASKIDLKLRTTNTRRH